MTMTRSITQTILRYTLAPLTGLFLLMVPVQAASAILNYNTDDTTEGFAVAVAVPRTEFGQLVVNRIRITSSRATATTYTFSHKRTSDSLFDTESLTGAGCAAPACSDLISIEGVQAGRVAEFNDLGLVLPRGSRLYMASDADIGANHQTIEVYYSQP